MYFERSRLATEAPSSSRSPMAGRVPPWRPATVVALAAACVAAVSLTMRPVAAWCDPDVRCDWNYDVAALVEANVSSPEMTANARLQQLAPKGTFLLARPAGDGADNATTFLRSPKYSGTGSAGCRLAIKALLGDARFAGYLLHNESEARPLLVEKLADGGGKPKETLWDTYVAHVGLQMSRFQIVLQLSLGSDSSSAAIKQLFYEDCVPESKSAACDFEDESCRWVQSENNSPLFDWQRLTGTTNPLSSGNYFPPVDSTYSNSTGHFLYVNPQNVSSGHRADLFSPELTGMNTTACKLSFNYYIRSFEQVAPPSINVYYSERESKGRSLASIQIRENWSFAEISVPRGTNRYRLIIAVRSGKSAPGGVAIDNIQLSPWCFEGPKVLRQINNYYDHKWMQKHVVERATYRFTTCGAFGRNGPGQSNCDATYLGSSSNVILRSVTDIPAGFQAWTVPVTDTYVLNAVGALGGLGANNVQQLQQMLATAAAMQREQQHPTVASSGGNMATMVDAAMQVRNYAAANALYGRWADRAIAVVNLTQGDVLLISIGQAGRPACQAAMAKHLAASEAQLMCASNKDSGGGGGGGATFIFLQRKGSDNISLLLVAAGGAGLGRDLPTPDFNASQAYGCLKGGGEATAATGAAASATTAEPLSIVASGFRPCFTKQPMQVPPQQRPGNGKLALPEGVEPPNVWLRRSWRVDLTGGWGCSDRMTRRQQGNFSSASSSQDTAFGGFGGGGGGCKAGGGGGGYPGGLVSPTNDPQAPGLAGTSYVNLDLATVVTVEKHEDTGGVGSSKDGAFELFRQPPPCPCEDICNWLDLNYTSFRCMCVIESWTLASDGRRCIPATGSPGSLVDAVAQADAGGGRLSFVEIALITVSLAAAAVVVACVIACRSIRKQRRTKRKTGMRTLVNDPTLASLQHPPDTLINSLSPNLLYEFACFNNFGNLPQISRDNLLLVKALGQGAFGEVFEGILSLGDRWDSKSISVAVKTSSAVLSAEQAEVDFLMEALIVSKFNHPNIVKFLGVCWDSCPRYIVLELLAGGDLRTFLREQRPSEGQPATKLAVGDLVKLSLDIAYACHHLEQSHFIHRDIAARNCLLTEAGAGRVAKIADFGMARDIYRADYYRKGGRALLPVKWMPPEAFLDGVFTTKTDVWSFGVLLWEIFSMGYMPYPGISNREVVEFVMRGGRMEPPRHAPSGVKNLMKLCWLQQSDKRPSFASTVHVLEKCLEECTAAQPQHIAFDDLAPYGCAGVGGKGQQDCGTECGGVSGDGVAMSPDDAAVAAAAAAAAAAVAVGVPAVPVALSGRFTGISTASAIAPGATAAAVRPRGPSVRFSDTTLSSDDSGLLLEAIDSPGATSCEPLLGVHRSPFESYRLSLPPSPASSATRGSPEATA